MANERSLEAQVQERDRKDQEKAAQIRERQVRLGHITEEEAKTLEKEPTQADLRQERGVRLNQLTEEQAAEAPKPKTTKKRAAKTEDKAEDKAEE